ncbi:MAG: hypothetical protein ACRD2C_16375 [Acidimicrobiales bacterium]
MDRIVPDALGHAEIHLTRVSRGREQQVLARWRRQCPQLTLAPISTMADLRPWVHRLPADQADQVLRYLVTAAQDREPASRPATGPTDDSLALLAVVVCLGPGIRSLAARTAISCDEAVSELALGILDFPVARRTRVAAGLLLDARNRLHRHARRQIRLCPLDEATLAEGGRPPTPEDPQEARPAAQRVVQLVCQAHREGVLNRTDARLILHTRIGGHQVRPIATELGLSTTAAYQRRSRAEARLSELVA